MNEKPYIERVITKVVHEYNPKYGDERLCGCGHPYYRHFDTYEEMYACGCKYCICRMFEQAGSYSGINNYWSQDKEFRLLFIPTGRADK